MWSRSLEEGFGCLGKFSDFILWSLERPLKGQIGAVIRIPSGDDRSGSCVEPAGKTRAAGPVRKLIAMMQALGVGVTEAQEAVEREADGPTPFTGSAEVLLLAGAVDLGVSGGTAAGFGAWGLELELLLGNV